MSRSFFKRVRFPQWSVPLGLLAACAAAYLPWAPQLGLYWDDWTQLLVPYLHDTSSYWAYFSVDRPFSGWTHMLFFPILGYQPLNWHLLSFGLRWASVVGMWWTFGQVWPSAKNTITLAAFLFAVYPSFTQQSDAVAYHQHWLQYALYFASMGCMAASLRARQLGQTPKSGWLTGLGVVAQLLHTSITEFFIGVELLRGLVLWFILTDSPLDAPQGAPRRVLWRERLKSLALSWLPYLVVDGLFVYWRLFLYAGDKNQAALLGELLNQPLAALAKLARFAAMDSLYTLLGSWANVFDLRLLQITQPAILFSWLMGAASAAGLVFFLNRLGGISQGDGKSTAWRWQILLFGGLTVLLGPAPIWAAGRQLVTPLSLDVHIDRFSMVGMYGASLIFAAGIDWLGRDWQKKVMLLAAAVGFCTGFHLRTGNDFRWIWVSQQRFYWQLYWRAPFIQPSTALVVEQEPLTQQELFSTSSALNFLYPQSKYPQQVGYWMYKLRPRYEAGFPEGFLPGFATSHRIFEFTSQPGNSLLLQYNPQETASCLWVLRPEDRGQPDLSNRMNQAIHISNLARIERESRGTPPRELFGTEPAQDWCYFFEKADLARQFKDWRLATELGDQAREKGYNPQRAPANSPYEWLPFIEGYIQQKRWDTAVELSVLNYQNRKDYGNLLCQLWSTHARSAPAEILGQIVRQIGCTFH